MINQRSTKSAHAVLTIEKTDGILLLQPKRSEEGGDEHDEQLYQSDVTFFACGPLSRRYKQHSGTSDCGCAFVLRNQRTTHPMGCVSFLPLPGDPKKVNEERRTAFEEIKKHPFGNGAEHDHVSADV